MNMEQLVKQITEQVMEQIEVKSSDSKNNQTQNGNFNREVKTWLQNKELLTGPQIARMIDHTLLKPESTKDQIVSLCKEAKQHQFASVCVNPHWVSVAANELRD